MKLDYAQALPIPEQLFPPSSFAWLWTLPEETDGIASLTHMQVFKKKIAHNVFLFVGPADDDCSDDPLHTLYYLHRCDDGLELLLVVRCQGSHVSLWTTRTPTLAKTLTSLATPLA